MIMNPTVFYRVAGHFWQIPRSGYGDPEYCYIYQPMKMFKNIFVPSSSLVMNISFDRMTSIVFYRD